MFARNPLVLQGSQVTLRPLAIEDADAMVVASSESRDSYRWTPVPDGISEVCAYLKLAIRQRDAGRRYPFAVVWNGTLVGSTSLLNFQPWDWPAGCPLSRQNRPDAAEIGGTWLSLSAQRTICNSEAKFLLLRHSFESWGVHRISFKTDERNLRSRLAIERLGAKFDGILRADAAGADCTVRNSACYSILSAEWPNVRERLLGLLRQR